MCNENCQCEVCRDGIEAVREKEIKAVEKSGWYAHYVPNDHMCPFGMNYHTHGFPEKLGCRDIQICFPVPQDMAHRIAWAIYHDLEQNKLGYTPGVRYGGILEGYEVQFIEAQENGRDVLRCILPSPQNDFEGTYAKQLEKTVYP